MKEQIKELIKNGNISIPRILLFNYKKLNITELELIILIYIINDETKEFNPMTWSKDLNIDTKELMKIVESLTSKNLINIVTKKEKVIKDIINLDYLYDKLLYLVINEEPEEKETDIYSTFEKEFGRTLAPMEYEIISNWLDSGYDKDLILEALKEAVYNGVFKLNYIDKILYEWNKKGIKNINGIKQDKENHKKQVEKKELYDYNWLEDE